MLTLGDEQDLRVLVTGAGSGIGLRIARAFQARGSRVHVCDVSQQALEANAGDIGTTRADVSKSDEVEALFADVTASLGGLDVLINNAGIAGPTALLEEVAPEDWQRTLDVNLTGAFLCCRKALPMLKANETASIVNIVSSAGLFGHPLRAPYAAAKWGLVGLTKTLAMELGPHGVRVNAICPGSVSGPRIEDEIASEAEARGVSTDAVRESYLRQSSMRTFVEAEDVANMALFVCSDLGKKISGQILGVDGNTETLSQL